MEKEKHKGRPRRREIINAVLTIMLLSIGSLCWAWSYYISPGHSLSDFSRFETEEEVEAFLHENFELNVTTYAEIRTFLGTYPLEGNGCRYSAPRPNLVAEGIVDESVAKIVSCAVPTWFDFWGERGYAVTLYVDTDELLLFMGANSYCRRCVYP